MSNSIDTSLKIYITEKAREELFKTVLEDESEIKYYLSAEYLEGVCLGKTHLPDYAYSQIRKLLKQEYKAWKEFSNDR